MPGNKRLLGIIINRDANRLVIKQDSAHIAILLAIALVIGVYLIATTVLISKDGVVYIQHAQQFARDPIKIIKIHPPGYPFLIMAAHKCTALFADDSSVFTWIYSAQSVTLLCKLLAIIPLYSMGKLLVGGKKSFWAILILIALPYPTAFGVDVMRDWPHILFLSTGLLFLIWGVRYGKCQMFAIAGMAAGLGHTIRPECVQIVVYGIMWMLIRLFVPSPNTSRLKAVYVTLVLLAGFALFAGPYMKARGKILPDKLKYAARTALAWKSNGTQNTNYDSTAAVQTAGMPVDTLKALAQLGEKLSDNLMHFFAVPLTIGLYCHFRKLRKVLLTERYFILTLMILYLVMTVMLHKHYGYIGRRHCMPMVVFTVFYIPVGLHLIARWLNRKNLKIAFATRIKRRHWFFILVAVGLGTCTAKFIRITPLRSEKQPYKKVAEWLRQNTAPEDIISVPDSRIALYAKRTMKMMQTGTSTVSGGVVSSESWYHIVGTFDETHQKLYINGKLVASAEPGFSDLGLSNNDLAIGKAYTEHASFFQGLIAEVRLYSGSLSDENIKALYNGRIFKLENEELIGCWTLGGEASGMNDQPGSAKKFNGTSDYIDLSHLGSSLNVDKLSVSVWTKPELLNRMNWIIGDKGQFRIGNRNSKVYFWIREKLPGHKIPEEITYVVTFTEEGSTEKEMRFNKRVRETYSVWVDKREKKKKIVIFKVL